MDKELMRQAYEHGVRVGTFLNSGLPSKYAPLTFDSWYDEMTEQTNLNIDGEK